MSSCHHRCFEFSECLYVSRQKIGSVMAHGASFLLQVQLKRLGLRILEILQIREGLQKPFMHDRSKTQTKKEFGSFANL
jgi:hypothetical protein